ncbi:MAG: lysostaphin resistance A-like protein [Brevibacterium aurantiacum]|uniref:CPBP family intramembrane glutamic endopeptidase n=1 Tax=Brevibacterium aurantiacum TaxID=273384 RepID=UPI003F8FBB5C
MSDGQNRLSQARRRTLLLACGAVMVFIVALAAWFGPSPGQFAVVLGWRNEVPVRGWAVAGAVAVGYTAYTLWAVPEIRPLVFERSWFRTIGVPLALLSGLIEEMFFRQVVMDWLAARGVTVLLQIVVSSLLFASAHAVWALFGKSWPATVPIRASTFGLGVLMSIVYVASDRVVLPAVLAHVAINLVIEPGLLLSSSRRAQGPVRDT